MPPVTEEPFDADVSRDGHDSVLRPSFLQVFAVGNRSDSPRVSVPLSSRLGPVSSKRRGPNQKGPEGLGTLGARELEGPVAVDPRACPRIGTQPARPLRDVNGDAPGHRCGSLKGNSLVPPRRGSGGLSTNGPCTCSLAKGGLRAKPSSTTAQLYWIRQAARGWDRAVNLIARTRKRDEKLFSFTIDAWRKELRGFRWDT